MLISSTLKGMPKRVMSELMLKFYLFCRLGVYTTLSAIHHVLSGPFLDILAALVHGSTMVTTRTAIHHVLSGPFLDILAALVHGSTMVTTRTVGSIFYRIPYMVEAGWLVKGFCFPP
ncbi:RNA recognition [Musa troglodytarum]|uniref:RNA recognition n=1 Tax=Musa troglodytarum TaxID=320322 RepID=A0A9E7JEB2_9LILI|nr:RNA recognition [Musa troglodytarum]